jgi:hypothetical protein
MKNFKFLENPKEEKNIEKKMFPQLFALSNEELLMIRGGNQACDAVCDDELRGRCDIHEMAMVDF